MAAAGRVAVLGAGMTGAVCARTLAKAGMTVTLFEMGRGSGGRMATRRTREIPALAFNHGAPAFAAAAPEFRAIVDSLVFAGVVREWRCRTGTVDAHGAGFRDDGERPLYVGVPGMSAICDHLTSDLDRRFGAPITRFQRAAGRWVLADTAGTEVGEYEWLVFTSHTVGHPRWAQLHGAPPPMRVLADSLPPDSPVRAMADLMAAVRTTPTMVVMVAFQADPRWVEIPVDLMEVAGSTIVACWVRQPAEGPYVQFVIHSTEEFANANIAVVGSSGTAARLGAVTDADQEQRVAAEIFGAFVGVIRRWVPEPGAPAWGPTLHRWANAIPLPTPGAERVPIIAPDLRLAWGGDHLGANGGSVEAAGLSGLRAAEAILAARGHPKL